MRGGTSSLFIPCYAQRMSAEIDFAQQSLEKWFAGRTLSRTEAEAGARIFRGCDLGLLKSLDGRLSLVARRGAHLVLKFSSGLTLTVQLGPKAKFLHRGATDEVKWTRARFFLDDGSVIHLQDLELTSHVAIALSKEKRALDVSRGLTVDRLQSALDRSNQELKVALRDDERVTGLTNDQVVEALYRAKLHPERSPASLSPPEWKALVSGMQAEGSLNLVAGAACAKCGGALEALTQAGEPTVFCATCQPRQHQPEGDQMRVRPRIRKYRG